MGIVVNFIQHCHRCDINGTRVVFLKRNILQRIGLKVILMHLLF